MVAHQMNPQKIEDLLRQVLGFRKAALKRAGFRPNRNLLLLMLGEYFSSSTNL
jgi:hypothetical protein